ncbi:NTF2_like domain containing protein [Acidimicrobiia bacterium]
MKTPEAIKAYRCPMDPDLRLLLDRQEIRDVVTRYFNSADRRDFVSLVDCFVPGALVDYSDLLPVSPTTPIADVAAIIDSAMGELYNHTQHFMGNHECTVNGDSATVETYCLAIHEYLDDTVDGGTRPTSALRYIDRFDRTTDGWRIAHRKAVRDIALQLPPRAVTMWEPASSIEAMTDQTNDR